MGSPICVVTKPWICRLWFPKLDYDNCMKHSDITCWIYSALIVSKMYGGLKSFQTAMSFQLGRLFSFTYFLDFFCASYKKSHNLYITNKLSISKWQIIFNIWNKKNLAWFRCYLIATWFSQTLLATLSFALSHSNFSLQ